MRNKGAVILVAVLLSLICLYYLSFTIRSNQISNRAAEFAETKFKAMNLKVDDLEKAHIVDSIQRSYLDSLSGEIVFWMFKNYTYKELRERELNLGLDLKGGMNVTIEVSASDIIKALSNNKNDSLMNVAIQIALQKQVASNEGFVNLFAAAYSDVSKGKPLAELFITSENKGSITIQSPDNEVIEYLREEYSAAIGNANEVLRKRIDHFGVVQPNIQEDFAIKGRFHIELPGIKDPERVRKLLQGTALLEFWETYENSEVFKSLEQINAFLAKTDMPGEPDTTKQVTTTDPVPVADNQNIILDDDDLLKIDADTSTDTAKAKTEEAQSPVAEAQNPFFELLVPNMTQQGELMPGPVVGRAHIKDTAKVNRILRDKKISEFLPEDLMLSWSFKPLENAPDYYELIALKRDSKTSGCALAGDVITNAREEFGQGTAYAEVTMVMDSRGANEWARITRVNKGRSIAIVLDGYVYSYPTVQNEIKGGRSSITGNFSINEAKDLANVLKSGKMPAPAHILSEEIVGPSLGQKAVTSGLNSFIIAFIIVLIYMFVYYGRPGLTADLALIANLFFIMGVLASFGAVLTLPGIAGVVLTIGMSVDANILIFERIREELRTGKALPMAIKDGYKNAYSAIIDANITTLLIAIILFNFGVGPIQGFATTLMIGIVASLFSAIFLTRLVFETSIKRGRKLNFETKLSRNAFTKVNFQFLDRRKPFYIASALLIVISIVSLTTRGLNPGIDFAGGRNYIVRFDKNVSAEEISKMLKPMFNDEAPIVKTFGASNQVKISTKYLIDSPDRSADEIVDSLLYVGLKPLLPEKTSKEEFLADYRQSSQKVGPAVADDIKSKSIVAIVLALIVIFIYILIRFKKWQYSMGAVAALIHDVVIVLGLYSLLYSIMPFSLEIDQAFIAAILTVVGYSINDTVVVFDRIREFLTEFKKRDRKETMNRAMNSTLSRTVGTSLTTLLVLLAIFIFGGEVIRGFIFAIIVGILIGTYSSIFIATPVTYELMKRKEKKELK